LALFNFKRRYLILFAVSLIFPLLPSCREERGPSPNQMQAADKYLKVDVCEEYEVPFFQGKSGTFEATHLPSWATLNPQTGKLSACPTESGIFSGIEFLLKKSQLDSLNQTQQIIEKSDSYTIAVLSDPLTASSWHLTNKGQNSFAYEGGVAGEDMRVAEVMKLGLTGSGVEVAISDSGLEIRHEDLEENILVGRSHNYINGSTDPTRLGPHVGDHGTSVAGIIGAVGWNGKGNRGIAPGAKLAGLNWLSPDLNLSGQNVAFYDQVQRNFAIINQSWGTSPICYSDPSTGRVKDCWRDVDLDYTRLLEQAVSANRGGKGTILIKAAGNRYPYNAAFDPDQRNPYKIVVGALNAEGKRASYSSAGANLWISGLGGEFGFDSEGRDQASRQLTGAFYYKSAIVTTDASGCESGYSRTSLILRLSSLDPESFFGSLFNYDLKSATPHKQNTKCNYTNTFNGTSAAATSISGVVALMLEKNPRLTWRDVKHILASTADQVDPASPQWVINQAEGIKKYHFNPQFGFGRANALAAVEMAGNYLANSLGAFEKVQTSEPAVNLAVPESSPLEQVLALSGPDPNLIIEAVEVIVNIEHSNPHHLRILIKSPRGTQSELLSPPPASKINEMYKDMPNISLLTNAFYGEKSQGNWTLSVKDEISGTTGTLKSWGLKVYGHRP